MATLKEQLEAQWNCKGVRHAGNVTVWHETTRGLKPYPGEERTPSVGKSAEKFLRRVRKHWGPAPMAYCGDAKPRVPDWVRANYKRNCPNNYADLIRLYGKLDKIDIELGKRC